MFKSIDTVRNNKGLTLIETVIAMFMGLVGMLGSFALLASVKGTLVEDTAVVQAQQEARNIVQRIARELRESSPKHIYVYNWSYPEDAHESDFVFFYTPRDGNRKFLVDDTGLPDWQREIAYGLDQYSHTLYRFQYLMSPEEDYPFYWEIVSENVEKLNFRRVHDLIDISVRTFADNGEGLGNVGKSYADFHTMVKMRN